MGMRKGSVSHSLSSLIRCVSVSSPYSFPFYLNEVVCKNYIIRLLAVKMK